ncbi:MAG: hypothetical protein A2X49_09945 [Lentisphaerae bacterium GWF2_52_8]|nr:MAG: hypothetical protein A2X49_09945 [Lentisphaerae bacterium GWF2_52_8]
MKKVRKYSFWYFYSKLVRHHGSPDYLARGLAAGVFIGLLIPMGFQLLIAIPMAFLVRGSKILAGLGTMITNPWSVTFIYPFQCWIGSILMGNPLVFRELNSDFKDLIKAPSWAALFDLGDDILIPFFVGGALLAVIFAVLSYFMVYGMVIRYRARKEQRLHKKLAAAASRTASVVK